MATKKQLSGCLQFITAVQTRWVTSALQKVKLRWKDFILQPQISFILEEEKATSLYEWYSHPLDTGTVCIKYSVFQVRLWLCTVPTAPFEGNKSPYQRKSIMENPRGNWKKALWQPNPLSLMVTIFPLLLFFIWILQMKLLNNVTEPLNVLTFCLQQHAWFCSRIIWERQIVLLC